VPSLSSTLQLEAAAHADPDAHPTSAGLPRIWSEGEETRDRFRALVPRLLRPYPESTVVGLCSTRSGEGTTTIAAGMACALAEAGHRVVVVDAHAARPGHTAGAWAAGPGGAVVPGGNGQHLLPLDLRALPNPAPGRGPEPLRALIEEARRTARVVLVDLEPLRESSQVLGLAGCVDAIYLVVEAGRERREAIARSVESLTRTGLPVGGLLLNKRERAIPDFIYRRL
jgi:Mrp family chromosome partitioning ATPase